MEILPIAHIMIFKNAVSRIKQTCRIVGSTVSGEIRNELELGQLYSGIDSQRCLVLREPNEYQVVSCVRH